jgi:glycosyltransferase involved in cell wall biosynthesis
MTSSTTPASFRTLLSIVVPCFNEAQCLPLFHGRLSSVLAEMHIDSEILYVDDGSSDETFHLLVTLAEDQRSVGVVKLSRNFGKESAMLAGLAHARGEAVVIIDADLQDPPELIAEMYRKWSAGGIEVVYAVRKSRRRDGVLKRATAAMFYKLFDALTEFDVPSNAGDFRLLSRRAVDAVLQMPERTRFSKGMFAWIGFNAQPVYFDRCERLRGHSKWSLAQLLGLSIQAVTSFSIFPLRIAGILGLTMAMAAGVYGAFLVVQTLVFGSAQPGYPSLMTALLFFSGLQLIFLGIIGEYVGRIFIEAKQRPQFVVDQLVFPFRNHRQESDGLVH